MVENIQIQNGDMITLARVMDYNTRATDRKVTNVIKGCNRAFNEIEDELNAANRRIKITNKRINLLCFGMFCLDGAILFQHLHVKLLERKIKKLEDDKVVSDFMKKEEEVPDFLK